VYGDAGLVEATPQPFHPDRSAMSLVRCLMWQTSAPAHGDRLVFAFTEAVPPAAI
jgi:hypothetical protein